MDVSKKIQEFLEQEKDGLDSITDSELRNDLMMILAKLDSYNELDHKFREILTQLAQHDNTENLIDAKSYSNIAETVTPNSTVIYFKTAGKIRVYQGNEFTELFQNRLRTNYRGKDEIYEVVDDNRPQKIVIVVDSRDSLELEKIKKYIIEYTKQNDHRVNMDDLLVFDDKSASTFDIVINNVQVANCQEKKLFTEGLLKYVESQEKNTNLSNKMIKRPLPDVKGANIVKIPELKDLVGMSTGEEIKAYLTKFGDGVVYHITINNIVNNGNIPGNDINIKNVKKCTEISDEDSIKHLEIANLDRYETGGDVEFIKL